MKMVPMVDMVAVVSADMNVSFGPGMRRKGIRVGDWARVSRDKYHGDLCRIVALGNGGASAVIMLVPRLNTSSEAVRGTDPTKSRGQMRPPMRLFNASEIIAAGGNVTQRKFRSGDPTGAASRTWTLADETFDVYENGSYLRGFLYKEVNVPTMLKPGDADPTLDELQRFVTDTHQIREAGASDTSKREAHHEQLDSLKAQVECLARGSGIKSHNNKIAVNFSRDDKVGWHLNITSERSELG